MDSSMNGPALSDSSDDNPSKNLGTLQNVDVQLLLTLLVQNGTLSAVEQQVVEQEVSSKARQCHSLLQIICAKGMQQMESFLQLVSLLQPHGGQPHPQSSSGGNIGYVGPSGEISTSSNVDHGSTVIGNHRDDQLSSGSSGGGGGLTTHHHASPTVSSLDSSLSSSLNLDRRSQLGNLNGFPGNGGGSHLSTPSLQEEISKAIEEKFGANSCNNLTNRLPPVPASGGGSGGTDQLDGAFFDPKASGLPSIPEFRISNGFPMKSPKLANRNVDLNCHAGSSTSSSSSGSNMVSQLLAHSSAAAMLQHAQNTNKNSNYANGGVLMDGASGMGGPVNEDPNPQYEFHEVILAKLPPYGFGIAVSGGRDNPHFENGDPSIAVSDVLKAGPAEGRLFINDIIVSVNGINLENVNYSHAIAILKDSPNQVNLLIKRRAPLHTPTTPNNRYAATTYTVNLPKTPANGKKKDDFSGLVLGCILYVKEINNRALADVHGIQIGDTVLKIGPSSVDHLAFHEVKKVLEKRSKERQSMVFQRPRGTRSAVAHTAVPFLPSNPGTPSVSQHRRQSSQNVYTELPTKTDNHVRQKSADSTDGRLVNPRTVDRSNHAVRSTSMNINPVKSDVSSPLIQRISAPVLPQKSVDVSQMHCSHRSDSNSLSAHPAQHLHPQFALPRPHDSENVQDAISLSCDWRFPDPRYVSFRKDGSVGLRLTGGNEAGIFVAASQAGSPAAMAGLVPGDKILKVNDKDMKGVTREEAVLFLLNLNDQIELVVQHRKQEFDYILTNQIGDSFYVRSHFNYDPDNKADLAFQCGDTFRVIDTLHTGSVGSWSVTKIGPNKVESVRGNVPSASRAEELAKNLKSGNKSNKLYSNTLADRIRRRSRRTKSLTKDQWDEVAFASVESKFPAYERVILKMPHFQRPIVFFGPLSDVARERLIKEFPDRYASPQMDVGGAGKDEKSGVVRLSSIRQFMAQNKHCVLDVTCQAVDRLNYAQMYPIVIFLKTESKDVLKEIRTASESKRKSTKKLIIEAQKIEKSFSYLFTGVVPIKSKSSWFRIICELIEQQQQSPIWMSEKPPDNALSDDFLFPMAQNLLYASSGPESDGENLYDTAPIPPPRRMSKDESHVNGISHARSPPAMGMSGINGNHTGRDVRAPLTDSLYSKHSTPNLSCDFKDNRPSNSQTYQAFPFKTDENSADTNHINLFATLRTAKPGHSASAFSRRPRPPPITVPSQSDDRFNGKPVTSVSFADLPSISNGTPSTSGAYEDPKNYDPYRLTVHRHPAHPPQQQPPPPSFTSTTLDRNHRHNTHRRPSLEPPQPPSLPSIASPSKLHNGVSGSTNHGNGYNSSSDIYGTRHPSIKEEPQAPPLPPKPKYLTNGRLRMFQQNGSGENGNGQATYSEPSPTKISVSKMAYNENVYGKTPHRPAGQKTSGRPYLEPIDTNIQHKFNGHRSHDHFLFADDDRTLSPNQMNFPPPPDDFLNSPNPNRLNAPEVIAEVRGFFDHNGGVLSSEETGVSLIIPSGALPPGSRQEVYFKVCREDNILSTLDKEKGERLLSPCVLCGPTGLVFLKPLELKLPHSSDSSPLTGSFNMKSPRNSVIRSNGDHVDQSFQSKLSPKTLHKNNASVSVYVDRF